MNGEQLELLGRTKATDTRDAAFRSSSRPTTTQQVLDFIRWHGPCTDREIEAGTGLRINSVTGRRNFLVKVNKVERATNDRNGSAQWILTR